MRHANDNATHIIVEELPDGREVAVRAPLPEPGICARVRLAIEQLTPEKREALDRFFAAQRARARRRAS
jgi:hypothetical protein